MAAQQPTPSPSPAGVEILPVPPDDPALRLRFVRFPWQVYQNDPLWTPPLLRSRLKTLDPARGTFFRHGEAALFLARRGEQDVGTIAAWINHRANRYRGETVAGFGFFEVLEDYPAAEALLSAACRWARARGMTLLRGPLYFSTEDSPGALVEGQNWPPVLLVGHTPLYYAPFLQRFGMRKYRDAYAYRKDLGIFGGDVNNLPPKLLRVARAVRRRTRLTIRNLRMADWDRELAAILDIFNRALGYQREHVPMDEAEFLSFANDLKQIADPDLIFLAENGDKPVGISITLPDINQVLRRMNGRLWPWGWLKFVWYRYRINVASLKILGVLNEYQGRGIEALFLVETVQRLIEKGYWWVDFSLIAEENRKIQRLTENLGAERYKVYRTFEMAL